MALYKSTELTTLQGHLPIQGDFDIALLLTFIEDVEQEHLIPVLGQSQYDDIDAAHNGGSPTADQTALIEKCQAALAPLLMMQGLDVLGINVGNNGLTIYSDENTKQAFEWQKEAYRKTINHMAFRRLELLIKFLEANKATYTIWAASDEFDTLYEGFINTADDFTKQYPKLAGSRQLFHRIRPIQLEVEDERIRAILGDTLYDAIKAEINSGNISSANNSLLSIIKKAVAYLTMERAMQDLPLELLPNAIMLLYTSAGGTLNASTASLPKDALNTHAEYCKERGESYLGKLKAYLDINNESYSDYPYDTDEQTDFENETDSGIFML